MSAATMLQATESRDYSLECQNLASQLAKVWLVEVGRLNRPQRHGLRLTRYIRIATELGLEPALEKNI
jgi:hypothetical protein